jgi:hypothetical protein
MVMPKDPIKAAETRRKLSESNRKRWADPQQREQLTNARIGKTQSEETKKKISDAIKGENHPLFGKHHTEESKALISENRRGKCVGEDNHNFGIPKTEESKQHQSEMMKGKHNGINNPMYDVHLTGEKNHFFKKTHKEKSKILVSAAKQGISVEEWKGYILPINLHIRKSHRNKEVCFAAMKDANFLDAFTKQKGSHKDQIECHHIIPLNVIFKMFNIKTKEEADACELLFDKHNLLVMLSSAHQKFHILYGDDKNIYELTPSQIQELYE